METWDAIQARRDVREFADRPVPQPQLDQILDAGRRAPSSQNTQPWDFVVVTQRERLGELSTVWQGAGHVAQSAATVALVAPIPRDEHQRTQIMFDLGQAAMSIQTEAADLGIGTGHSAVGDQERARRILGIPEGRFCAYLIPMGYPADRPLQPVERPNRRPFNEVVHREHW
ncbi:nitroreductase family protein [Dactylosporangium fulvum]|uniref:Nitroreductase family protein n=1 Tax=Dactylosporangium fulvum TaxID=53359 RepID=A0ABY5VMH2_9ACTN|nr:nitroreductase family protein [Dactylosporangium fulvum]UWP78877.1 nitroreductase family protein [Dactylosporangium fulvum]